jgi:hypothetical protein
MATNNAINAPFPLSTANGGLGVASPTAHGVLIGEGASAVTPIVLTAGQVLIGTTSSDPVGATITQGTGITVTSATGSITIANAQSALTFNDQTTASVTMTANNSYVIDDASNLVTLTLPTTAALGAQFQVVGFAAGGWKIGQAAGQTIHFRTTNTTAGTGGSLQFSDSQYNCVTLVCSKANTDFTVVSSMGNISYV